MKILNAIVYTIMVILVLWYIGWACDGLNSGTNGYDDYYQDVSDLPM